MAAINLKFISNNVKGLEITKKWIKLFEYFKSKLAPSVFILPKKLIQPRKLNKNGKMDCMGKYFFRMGNPIHVVFL